MRVSVPRYISVTMTEPSLMAIGPSGKSSPPVTSSMSIHVVPLPARPAYRQWRASFLKLWNRHNMQLPNPNALFPEEFDEAEATGRAVAGAGPKVRDFLARDITESGVNYVLCRFAFGSLTRAEAERSISLFMRHVMGEFVQ